MHQVVGDSGTVLRSLRTKREVVFVRLVFCLFITACGLYFFWIRTGGLIRFLAWAVPLVLFLLIEILYPLTRILISGVALIVTDRGLIDRTGGFNFISWAEIRGAHLKPFAWSQLIALDIVNERAVISRQPIVRRLLLLNYLRNHTGAFSLKPVMVEGGADALLALIKERATGDKVEPAV
jgi:hypothetical protein